jgi:hypothetical protein
MKIRYYHHAIIVNLFMKIIPWLLGGLPAFLAPHGGPHLPIYPVGHGQVLGIGGVPVGLPIGFIHAEQIGDLVGVF